LDVLISEKLILGANMKHIWSVLISTAFFSQASFGECHLATPISIAGKSPLETDQSKMIILENVIFDRAYKTKVIPPASSVQNMELRIFEILWSLQPSGEPEPTGNVGVHFGPEKSLHDAGFSFAYGGNFNFEGASESSGDLTRYTTKELSNSDSAMTATEVTVQGQNITGIQITVPVRDYVCHSDGACYTPYLGENETLCVTSAKLKK
jgi:hypothetical protein